METLPQLSEGKSRDQAGVEEGRSSYTAAELVDMELPEPTCVVEGLITEGLNLLVSRPKIGKSWMALDLSLAVAGVREKVLGRLSVVQGDVLYLALEDNRRRLKSRLLTLLDGERAPERLTLATEWPRIDDGGLEKIAEWIESVEEPRLVVLDTIAKVRSRGVVQADRYADDYRDVGTIQTLANDRGVSILGNHHVRKAMSEDFMDDVSGTIGITAAADTVMVLRRERGKADASLHLTGRDIDEQEIGLGWSPDSCRWTHLGDARELRMSLERKAVLDCIQENAPIGPTAIANKLGKTLNNIKQLLYKMAENGDVKSDDGKYSAITPITQ